MSDDRIFTWLVPDTPSIS